MFGKVLYLGRKISNIRWNFVELRNVTAAHFGERGGGEYLFNLFTSFYHTATRAFPPRTFQTTFNFDIVNRIRKRPRFPDASHQAFHLWGRQCLSLIALSAHVCASNIIASLASFMSLQQYSSALIFASIF